MKLEGNYSPQQGANPQQFKINNPRECVIGSPVVPAQQARSGGDQPRRAVWSAAVGCAAAGAVCGTMGGAPCVLGAFGAAANAAWQCRDDPELS
mmetsp:Transcript_6621/g.16248  ORF Transcript_6621/g.16248 Transcript_6621/m.16248 type:complete len:94 (-) Transcript_6621:42-323(-)|eukprot:CAMPEP_0175941174 /NCGR_PEP_ID=MMETSP0108-20121206/24244_1 /TAXON_ID=195067 ORGANISM="Goniomonas pacifica, Strain CCMP1869" /NCGR_SAMPLE_ID=MMETSP0108 /ASSEMBLY_ACC=CAM_ASM_000204 /LENGTH=93 /DNA_ID=CAMNT_0017265785 /DNA_START=66 /DNA_END=347 /DNA_ORIENTATION=+